MATTLDRSPELPDQLRILIWMYVLRIKKEDHDAQVGCTIELSGCDRSASTMEVAGSIAYPELSKDREGTSTYSSFSVCVKFSKDLIYILKDSLSLNNANHRL